MIQLKFWLCRKTPWCFQSESQHLPEGQKMSCSTSSGSRDFQENYAFPMDISFCHHTIGHQVTRLAQWVYLIFIWVRFCQFPAGVFFVQIFIRYYNYNFYFLFLFSSIPSNLLFQRFSFLEPIRNWTYDNLHCIR